MSKALGLDIGTNSVGWALLEEDTTGTPTGIIACGSRIFKSCVDDKTRTPLNQERRAKRLLRRQIARRRQRRDLVRGLLIVAGLHPTEVGANPDGEAGAWNRIGDPYQLRAEALNRRLEPFELGRVFLVLSKRRGFQSNRKADKPKEDDEKTSTDEGIARLQQRMRESGAKTLGEYLWKHADRRGEDLLIRNRLGHRRYFTERSMLRAEFEAIWQAQQSHHPSILTGERKICLYRAIFWQRPLKAPARAGDGCAFEPAKIVRDNKGVVRRVHAPRAALAWPSIQRLRFLQRVNDLRWLDPLTLEERTLTPEQRQSLVEALEHAGSLTWGSIRKMLKFHKGCAFNLESATDDKGLKGNATADRLRERIEDDWDTLDEWVTQKGSDRLKRQFAQRSKDDGVFTARHQLPTATATEIAQDLLVIDLLTIDDHPTEGPISLLRRLQEDWGFTHAESEALSQVELERRPGRSSLKAARRLLPHLLVGKNLHDAAQAVGYERIDQRTHAAKPRLGQPPHLRNPVVNRALTEVRHVVNAIARRFGVPDTVRVEVAREASMSGRERSESDKERKRLEQLNAQADDWWREQLPGRTPSRDDRVAYRLWQRQKLCCLYSDRTISGHHLVDGSVQVDHILPYSQSLDDSFANKALVFADSNQAKGNRTPKEWLSAADFAELMARARNIGLPGSVTRRLLTEHVVLEEFIKQALVDTRWINRAVLGYLRQLWPSHGDDDKVVVRVEAPRGHTTAALRHQWGLAGLLGGDTSKNRADHRHHALDAVVIACTGRRVYTQAAQAFQHHRRALDIPAPWASFRDDLKAALNVVVVSHANDRRIRGALHLDTAYGVICGPDGDEVFVSRCPVERLTKPAQIEKIIDPRVRALVAAAVAKHGSIKVAAEAGIMHADGKTPIQRVRIDASLKRASLYQAYRQARAYRFHQLKNNHRLEVLVPGDGKKSFRLVRMLDHAQATRIWERAVKNGDSPIDALPEWLKPLKDGTTGALVMSLHIGDAVRVDESIIGVVSSLSASGTKLDVEISHHTDAAKAKEADRIRISSLKDLTTRLQPIAVTVLGEVIR